MPLKRVSSSVVLAKRCTRCFEVRPMAEYGVNRRNAWDGRQPFCRECGRAAQRDYRTRVARTKTARNVTDDD